MSRIIKKLGSKLEGIFTKLIKDVPSFEVLNTDVLPYGLKQHTRSICWLAEQVILQNVKKRQAEYGISDYRNPDSDISAWDAYLDIKGCSAPSYINIKVSDGNAPDAISCLILTGETLRICAASTVVINLPIEFGWWQFLNHYKL